MGALRDAIAGLVSRANSINTFYSDVLASKTAAAASASRAASSAASAAAVVTGGTASLTSASGKIPLANGSGKIDREWIDGYGASAKFETWAREYSIGPTSSQEFVAADGLSLSVKKTYLVRLICSITGSAMGAVYVVSSDDNVNWSVRLLYQHLNHPHSPVLAVDANVVKIYNGHATNSYDYVALVEEIGPSGFSGGPYFPIHCMRITDNYDGVTVDNPLSPATDNARTLGKAALRWSVLYAGTGTINTSDAREKTTVRGLSSAEINAARALSAEIGAYQFLAAVAEKGADVARLHIGMTVQRAMQIMTEHGLDPLRYGFICYDSWECGDRYSFRPDELLMFVARGFEARLAALESA